MSYLETGFDIWPDGQIMLWEKVLNSIGIILLIDGVFVLFLFLAMLRIRKRAEQKSR